MQGSYPAAATSENWLHESLVEMIRVIHEKLDSNHAIPSWAELIPLTLNIANAKSLKSLHGIKSRLKSYESSVQLLTAAQRVVIYQEMQDQNDINGLLSGSTPLENLRVSFPDIYSVVHDLFVFAYDKLTYLKIRDRQYVQVFKSLKNKICIFCGVERMMSPQETRQDQDHILPKSIYPFSAANMKNLAPMCRCCNRDFKHDMDVLVDSVGKRRKSQNPYSASVVEISLVKSLPFEGTGSRFPAWCVDFSPAIEESETWDQVFCIRTRYSRDVLNNNYDRWIGGFMMRCKARKYPVDLSDADVLKVLKEYCAEITTECPVGLDFLKPKVFEMLVVHFELTNDRVIKYVRDMVCGISLEA